MVSCMQFPGVNLYKVQTFILVCPYIWYAVIVSMLNHKQPPLWVNIGLHTIACIDVYKLPIKLDVMTRVEL